MVAPHAGAWIETSYAPATFTLATLPPTRGHGLKHRDGEQMAGRGALPPTRGHGLKLIKCANG